MAVASPKSKTSVHSLSRNVWNELGLKIVSQNRGQAFPSVTLDAYTHLTEDKKKEQEAVLI